MKSLVGAAVWLHAAVIVAHSAAHIAANIWMPLAPTLFIWTVIIIGPFAGLWLFASGRNRRAGAAIVGACMTGALVFGMVNHFLIEGSDHVSAVAGPWGILFALSACGLALTETGGVIAAAHYLWTSRGQR